MKKLLNKLLPFLGIALIVAGLVVGLLTNRWATEAISLLVSGVVSIVLWLLLFTGGKNSFWEKRTTQAGTNALVATTAVIIILSLANFLGNRYSYRQDFTDNQLYTLAPETQEVVRNLSQPLQLYIFDRQISEDDRTLLTQYQRYNPLFKFEFIDPDKQIGLVEQYKVKALGEVYLKYGEKKKLVQSLKLGENLSEIQLTNSIVQIQRDRTQYIYFLQGHGEAKLGDSEGGFSEAINALKAKGYRVESLNLIQAKSIPNNSNLLIIAGAKRKLFPAEITTIKNYLDRGGKLLLTIEPNAETGLETLLKDWGIESPNFLIIDASGTGEYLGYGVDTPVVGTYGNHPITKDFGDGLSVYPQSRPILITKTKNIEAVPLAITSLETWAESDLEAPELSFNPDLDIQGSLNIAVALTRKITSTAATETKPSPTPKNTPDSTNSTQDRKITPSPTPKPTLSPQSLRFNDINGDDRDNFPQKAILVSYIAQNRSNNTPNSTPTNKPPTSTPSPIPTPTSTSTPTTKPTPTNTPPKTTPSQTPTPTNTPSTTTPSPTSTSTPTPTSTNTPSPTPTPTSTTNTPSPTSTPTPTPKPTATNTPLETQPNTKPNEKQTTANMVIFGNTAFASNGWFQQQLNSDIFINSVNWLTDDGNQTLSIRPKQQKNRRINLNPTQAEVLTLTALFIVPSLGLIAAGIMWWRRR